MNIKNWKLSYKLTGTLLLAGLLPLFVAGIIVDNKASSALEKVEYNLLESARDTKKSYIEDYFSNINSQAITYSENLMVIDAMKSFKSAFHSSDIDGISSEQLAEFTKRVKGFYHNDFNPLYTEKNKVSADLSAMIPKDKKSLIHQYHYIANNDSPLGSKSDLVSANSNRYYDSVHERYHPTITNYLNKFGYYDIFLVDADTGHVVYSVFKELDYATSLKTGPYKNTQFAKVFNRALTANKGTTFIEDFKSYAPSYEAAASFMAAPIYDGDTLEGVLVFQMPVGHINKIMQSRSGLGETGETYLVGRDSLMRSQSNFTEEDTIAKKAISSGSLTEALDGKTGNHIVIDDTGTSVVSSYAPLSIKGLDWVLIAEMDEAEAFSSVVELRTLLIVISCISLLIIVGLALLFTRSVLKKLGADPSDLSHVVSEIAEGNLDLDITVKESDKISVLFSMKTMQEKLKSTITNISEAASTITVTAKEISVGNVDLSQRTEKQAASLEETASSIEELTSTVKQNAENAQQANQLANGASEIAVKGGEVVEKVVTTMSDINESSSKIVDIISVIDGIAFQTNILALNAAVEAARAGEQGRGFAVVAAEVRSLAQRSAGAAKEIKTLIDESVGKVEAGATLVDEAGTTMNEIVISVKRVTDIMAEISAASMEQSTGINQVNVAITQMDDVTQQNATLVEEAAAGAESLEQQAQILDTSMSAFTLSKNQVNNGAQTAMTRPNAKATNRPSTPKLQSPNVIDDEWEEF